MQVLQEYGHFDFATYDIYLKSTQWIEVFDPETPESVVRQRRSWLNAFDTNPFTAYSSTQLLQMRGVNKYISRRKDYWSPTGIGLLESWSWIRTFKRRQQSPSPRSEPAMLPHFLRLPLEIRRMIYGYLLEPLSSNPPLDPSNGRLFNNNHFPIPSNIGNQFFTILPPENRRLPSYNSASARRTVAVIIQPRKEMSVGCCYHNFHPEKENGPAGKKCQCRFPLYYPYQYNYPVCTCTHRTLQDYRDVDNLARVCPQITAELAYLVWKNAAITFGCPESFNIFASNRPSTIPLIKGITLVINLGDGCSDLSPTTLERGYSHSLERMLAFLIKHYTSNPLSFFYIEMVTKRFNPRDGSYYQRLEDELIEHWAPMFRKVPAQRFRVHVTHSRLRRDPDTIKFTNKLRDAWVPDLAKAIPMCRVLFPLPIDDYLEWRKKILASDASKYTTFKPPLRMKSFWLKPYVCRCDPLFRKKSTIMTNVCHVLYRTPVLCQKSASWYLLAMSRK